MKVSYLCANPYVDPAVFARASFPYPPGLYDPVVGAKSVEAAFANAGLADELGFDWVMLDWPAGTGPQSVSTKQDK